MAYIKKEPLCAWLENMGVSAYIIDTIKNEEHFPIADVAEVVRCKGCKYNDNGDCICPDNITHSYDSEWNEYDHYISIYSDHYCGYGERRDG